jgi:CBS domain-containing protein
MESENLTPYLTTETATLLEAARVIRGNYARTAVVVDDFETRKVLGVISEGDILEASLQGVDVHTPITEFVNHSFTYLHEADETAAQQRFAQHGFGLIPVVDDQMQLQHVYTMLRSFRKSMGIE